MILIDLYSGALTCRGASPGLGSSKPNGERLPASVDLMKTLIPVPMVLSLKTSWFTLTSWAAERCVSSGFYTARDGEHTLYHSLTLFFVV